MHQWEKGEHVIKCSYDKITSCCKTYKVKKKHNRLLNEKSRHSKWDVLPNNPVF